MYQHIYYTIYISIYKHIGSRFRFTGTKYLVMKLKYDEKQAGPISSTTCDPAGPVSSRPDGVTGAVSIHILGAMQACRRATYSISELSYLRRRRPSAV